MKTCTVCKKELPRYRFHTDGYRGGAPHPKCKSCVRDINKSRRPYFKARYQNMRNKLIESLGGKCECCGESCHQFLTIDHSLNDGALKRRVIGKGRTMIGRMLKTEYAREGLRVLCYNCNCSRSAVGACPHESSKQGAGLHS